MEKGERFIKGIAINPKVKFAFYLVIQVNEAYKKLNY
jgi:hypothetical protein